MYLPQALPLRRLPAPGRYRTLYAAHSTPITWSSLSGSHCEDVRPIHWNP